MGCSQCQGIERLFDSKVARRELRFYRWMGPRRTTSILLSFLRPLASSSSLLDIGGGVGVIQHELFDSGLNHVIQVDGASAYIQVSREEANRRGHSHRIDYFHGDFVELVQDKSDLGADLVTLDRVICCYPLMNELLGSAADRARRAVALVFPRDGFLSRMAGRIGNLFVRLFDPDYKMYIHASADVDRLMHSRGFEKIKVRKTLFWQVQLFLRTK